MQVSAPGVMELVTREIPKPQRGHVLIEIEACGICGADAGTIEGSSPAQHYPRVPGHEIVGRISRVGEGVPSRWTIGQRVGVGRLGGCCNNCERCRHGQFQLCSDQPVVGSTQDGGYAEVMLVRSTGLVALPDSLEAIEAAPILCAGIATFNALRKLDAYPGDLVAVQGIGGLGHLGIQYARKMGYQVVAIGRGESVGQVAMALGAHVYIDARLEDPVSVLNGLGGAEAILTTLTNSEAVSPLMDALAPKGKLVVLGIGGKPISVFPRQLVAGERVIEGSITGTPYDTEKALRFSTLFGIRPSIETFPLKAAKEAYEKVISGDAEFRVVLTMG